MKISDTKAVSSAKKNKKSNKAGEADKARFASLVESAMDKPSEEHSQQDLSNRHQQQHVSSDVPEKAEDRGAYMLDKLESLEKDILSGNSTSAIAKLKEALATRAVNIDDLSPKMRNLLDEIDLRASIEVAKLED